MGNASDSHLLCWEATLLIGSFMLQLSSAISPVQGAVLGTADSQVGPVLENKWHGLAGLPVPPGALAHSYVEGAA